MSGRPLLEMAGVCKSFGAVRSLVDAGLAVGSAQMVGLIGPNGAGKSTLINVLTGVYPPDRGRIVFAGADLAGVSTAARARRGLVRTFQRPCAIAELRAIEGVMVGGFARGLSFARARSEAERVLATLGLDADAGRFAAELPTGKLKLLDLARVLMLRPKLVLLDELMAGLSVQETALVLQAIEDLASDGTAFLIVEHLMEVIRRLSRVLIVMDAGRVIAQGPPERVIADPKVIAAYLGPTAEAA